MEEHVDLLGLQTKILAELLRGSATSTDLAKALTTSEVVVLAALEPLRNDRWVEFMGGDWSLTDEYRRKAAAARAAGIT